MALKIKIQGNFIIGADNISRSNIFRLPRNNTRYIHTIEGANDYFEFFPIQYTEGITFVQNESKFLFTDIIDDRTGLAFTSTDELNEFLSLNIGGSNAPVNVLKYTGWEYYKDNQYTSAAPLTINNSNVKVSIDGLAAETNTSQSPSDAVNPLWDTTNDKIQPINEGDAYSIRFSFTGKSNKNTYFRVKLDIGTPGSPIIISAETKISPNTSLSPTIYSFDIPIFCLNTFATNGGKIYIDNTDDASTMDCYDFEILIVRTHKAN